MFITSPLHINQLMQQSLIGARVDDPVIPERTPRRSKSRRKLRLALTGKSPAAGAHPSASRISSSTTSPPRPVTS